MASYDFNSFNSGSLSDYEKKQILLKGRMMGKSQMTQAYIDAYNNMSSGIAKPFSNIQMYNSGTSPSKAQLKLPNNLETAKRALNKNTNSGSLARAKSALSGTNKKKSYCNNNLLNAMQALRDKKNKKNVIGANVGTWGTQHQNLSASSTYHPMYSQAPRLGTKADLSNPPGFYNNSYDPQSLARTWANEHFDLAKDHDTTSVRVIPKKVEDERAAELMTKMMNSDEMNKLRGSKEYIEVLEKIYNMYGENNSI